ncbi:Mannose-1-phosphate guanylyltransferase (fragment) [Candidatus Desulfarcum epimagneticum]|uniref:mannose-1-phosphate guanylyltransferase n=1 Tax=uncultured Desulfobacteraceae bacterium TaxID=218296 RepID=A0A484HF76_9BACT
MAEPLSEMDAQETKSYAILLAGGSGSRLWPVSRQRYPKQLARFAGRDSMIQSVIKRVAPAIDFSRIKVVCGAEHCHDISRHMEEAGISPEGKIYVEPCGRNTAPAILLGALHILSEEKDAICCVFPADHVIKDEARFNQKLQAAIRLASQGHMVTFGIRPHYPETGYGYIEGGEKVLDGALSIKRFVEKPPRETAEAYIEAGNFFWNSGMFAFKASVLIEEMNTHLPGLVRDMRAMLSKGGEIPLEDYRRLPDISIDHAIMEKTRRGVALPADFGWSDIGTWKSLYDFLPKDENQNVISGDVVARNARGCLIMGHKRLVVANHLTDMVIVETPDSIFVSDLKNSREVKSVVEDLKKEGRAECRRHVPEYHSGEDGPALTKKMS